MFKVVNLVQETPKLYIQVLALQLACRQKLTLLSGLYYPPQSLKTRLCLRGRDLLYERCKAHNIPHRRTGKLVVASGLDQQAYIENLHSKSFKLQWPPYSDAAGVGFNALQTQLLSGDEAREMVPNLSPNITGALWCPQTGILDSHAYMESLEKDIINSGGDLAYATRVVRLDRYKPSASAGESTGLKDDGWVVQVVTGEESEGTSLLSRTLINAAGLSGTFLLNSTLPKSAWLPIYYARGSYASYHGPGASNISHLIYPCPRLGSDTHAFQSLGTHLTLDLQGKVRFGPDIEWINAPEVSKFGHEELANFWVKYLIPDESRLKEMHVAITNYLPDVTLEGLEPDYVGIRPKLVPPTGGFQDFVLRTEYSNPESQTGLMINLLGIESPGLTASLAVAEMVVEELIAPRYKDM
ncbi:hypothetical protein AX16_000241 [Volvariella volvacea WC 439]|nr:hypothetical protein AX16_000241 [Volvariella volvacea WC 439]